MIWYYAKDRGWSSDVSGATICLVAEEINAWFIARDGAWVNISPEELAPEEQGLLWTYTSRPDGARFRGLLSVDNWLLQHFFSESEIETLSQHEFLLDRDQAEKFVQQATYLGARFREEILTPEEEAAGLMRLDLLDIELAATGRMDVLPSFEQRKPLVLALVDRLSKKNPKLSRRLLESRQSAERQISRTESQSLGEIPETSRHALALLLRELSLIWQDMGLEVEEVSEGILLQNNIFLGTEPRLIDEADRAELPRKALDGEL